MRKRITAFLLVVVMMVPALSVFTSAVPYLPSANAWKDFGQEHNYFYQVNKGSAAPRADGYITPSDGYGEPISTYGFRYITTADKAAQGKANGEYKLKDDGDFYVYPTASSPAEIWDSITAFEVENPHCYIWNYYFPVTDYASGSPHYYSDPDTHTIKRAYQVTEKNFKPCTIMDNAGNYILRNPVVLSEEPADWATSYKNYYTKVGTAYKPVADSEAPTWKANTYYKGEKTVVDQLYRTAEGSAGSIVSLATLKSHRVMLPEKVNLYARYDANYLYYAIEVVEETHKNAYYNLTNYFGTSMTNSLSPFANGYDYHNYYRKDAATGEMSSDIGNTIRTYSNYVSTITSTKYILAKFGNPDATYDQLQVVGADYNITRSKYVPPVKENNEEEDLFGDLEDDSEDAMTSGTYGTTVYEYRLPWKMINGKYNLEAGGSAVPEMFTIRQEIDLDNKAGSDAFRLSLTLPRTTGYLPGGINRTGANYPSDFSTMRYPDNTGLTEGAKFGTYNFRWRTTDSSSYTFEKSVTDYYTVDNGTSFSISHYPPVFFPSGQDPAKDYAVPQYEGAQLRADGAEGQMMRIKFSIGETEMDVAEAGVIVAPTEVVRRQQLRLGISSVKYYAEDNPVLYAVVDGKWVNLTTLADEKGTYMSTAADQYLVSSDSYMAQDDFGGKPSGIYTVYTLPVADLEDPYDTVNTEDGEKKVYSVVFGGPKGEGIYNDFDDFNTFYTIRPYIRYEDGTVVYGEQEYKSLYYLACWQIQDIIDEYNVTKGLTETATRYNMDQMQLAVVKDKSGKELVDYGGASIYLPVQNTSGSPFNGASEYSIYHDARRSEVFRWYAVKLASRRNGNTPLRMEDYPNFDPNTKFVVDQYHQMLENIWQVIESAETNRYLPGK